MKKLNKFFAILVSLAMMATLCVCMAFADDPVTAADHFALTKELQMPDGTNTPGVVFNFNIEATEDANDHTATGTVDLEDKQITYTAGGSAANQTLDEDDVFPGEWDPGKYVYIITEDDDSATYNDALTGKTFTFDGAKYKVIMYVNADNEKSFTIYKWDSEKNEYVKDTNYNTGEDGTTAEAKFTNTYVKTTVVNPNGSDPDPSNDSAGYAFEKLVADDEGGLYTNKEWTFDVDVTIPALSKQTGYTYEVWNVGTTGENGTASKDTTKGGTITAAGGQITLKTGQRAVFTNLDVGAVVNVKEANTDDINEAATLKVGNTAPAGYAILDGDDVNIVEGEAKYLKVTNTPTNSTAPEGIMINNLPYIVLALVAIGGLVAYVVIRRRDEDNA